MKHSIGNKKSAEKQKVFLVHGWESSPQDGWWPWLKKELTNKGFMVAGPKMPNPSKPAMREWVKKLRTTVSSPDKNCYFIGHSLGCITILRYIESLGKSQSIGGAVLVAGFTSNLGYSELDSFFKKEIDWKKIKSRCAKFAAIHSKNDRYVSLHYGSFFEKKLRAKFLTEEKGGHFTAKDRVKKLPIVLESILEMMEPAKKQ